MRGLIALLIGWMMLWGAGCSAPSAPSIEEFDRPLYKPHYAQGFEILGHRDSTLHSTLIRIRNPWQEAQGVEQLLFVARNGESAPQGFRGTTLKQEAQRIVCLASSHVALLDALGEVERIVGISGRNFIHNPYIRSHTAQFGEMGYDSHFNYELLVALEADLVLLYGVFGPSVLEPKLKELGIPYLYVGEYVENSPLGKAEWVVALGEVTGQREEAVALFATLPPQYNHWRTVAQAQSTHPKVMLNTPYNDHWFMPNPTSYVARLIADAGGDYLMREAPAGSGSLKIDLEEATLLTARADVWLDASNQADLEALKRSYPKFADLNCVVRGEVYNNDRRVLESGGNDYWESGVMHPHLILRDLVKIFYPEAVEQEFYYYRKL